MYLYKEKCENYIKKVVKSSKVGTKTKQIYEIKEGTLNTKRNSATQHKKTGHKTESNLKKIKAHIHNQNQHQPLLPTTLVLVLPPSTVLYAVTLLHKGDTPGGLTTGCWALKLLVLEAAGERR